MSFFIIIILNINMKVYFIKIYLAFALIFSNTNFIIVIIIKLLIHKGLLNSRRTIKITIIYIFHIQILLMDIKY